MKKILISSLLTTFLIGNVFADTINVPFINAVVPVTGLTISYNMPAGQEVFCITDNFYKGYLTITENGVEKDAGIAYGNYDSDLFYFTHTGKNNSGDGLEYFHVDQSGHIIFKDTNYKPHTSSVSCVYVNASK